jgi:stage II sporulation protein D
MARLSGCSLGVVALGAALLPLPAQVRAAQPPARALASDPLVRVLVWQAPVARLRPAAAAAGVQLRDGAGRVLQQFPGQAVLQVEVINGWLQLRQADDPSAEQWQAREFWLEALPGADEPDPGLWLQQRRYRGRLQLRLDGGVLQAVNHLQLETYLSSVVGSEMPASWPMEALRAQAVAARTYALKARKPAAVFDLQATTASQVYKGVESETPSTRAAVEGTRGLVLTYNNTLIDAVFHSSSAGGSTESSGDLWAKQMPYLVGVRDFDDASPVRDWRQPLDQARLRQAFPELGGALGIEVLATTPTGRISQARVLGPSGQLALTGAQLRSRLGLKSTWVRFELAPPAVQPPPPPVIQALTLPAPAPAPAEVVQLVAVGRGFGHGIGMSQWGALAMAQRGQSYADILRHYYRGTALQPFNELARTAKEDGQVLAVSR